MNKLSDRYVTAVKKRLTALSLSALMILCSGCVCLAESENMEEESSGKIVFAGSGGVRDEEGAAEEDYSEEDYAEEDYAEEDYSEEDYAIEDYFQKWDPDAPALQVLTDYVDAVTDESSSDFIPVEDRIAVFDMSGTLYGELFPTNLDYYMLAWRILEDPTFEPDAEMLAFGRELRESVSTDTYAEDLPIRHAIEAAKAYAGMTVDKFSEYVMNILMRDADGFEGLKYGEAFYLPMIEVVDYLQDNNFTVFVVSGSDRDICRTLLDGVIDVPYERIIGTDVAVEASGQLGADGLDYVYQAEDEPVRTDRLLVRNNQMNKVSQIARDIGRQPVLSFGNSSGDVSMHMYTISGNPYRSEAFMLIADDEERDHGNSETAEQLRDEWEECGFEVISMKNDFLTIYGDDVATTDSFRWDEEMEDSREYAADAAADSAPDAADVGEIPYDIETLDEAEPPSDIETLDDLSAPPDIETLHGGEYPKDIETTDGGALYGEPLPESLEDSGEVQYVMYLGTNSQTDGEPVCTPEEAKEIVKSVLIKYFSGYTLQDASGGWVDDDGTLYQENTVVIYLSDTTEEQVHAAADELIQVFDQSSVLIQKNPTDTEFYSGS